MGLLPAGLVAQGQLATGAGATSFCRCVWPVGALAPFLPPRVSQGCTHWGLSTVSPSSHTRGSRFVAVRGWGDAAAGARGAPTAWSWCEFDQGWGCLVRGSCVWAQGGWSVLPRWLLKGQRDFSQLKG